MHRTERVQRCAPDAAPGWSDQVGDLGEGDAGLQVGEGSDLETVGGLDLAFGGVGEVGELGVSGEGERLGVPPVVGDGPGVTVGNGELSADFPVRDHLAGEGEGLVDVLGLLVDVVDRKLGAHGLCLSG